MKIALVVPRYGLDIIGGAEYHARQFAEHLNKFHDIEVLTTCATDYRTWKNVKNKGSDSVNGISILRFPVSKNRKEKKLEKLQYKAFHCSHTRKDEISWIHENGPYCMDLIHYIRDNKQIYDYFLFFTFRYFTTYYGILEAREKSILIPEAEDDNALLLTTTREIFTHTSKICYNVPDERELILSKVQFTESDKYWDIVGCGIEHLLTSQVEHINLPYILYVGRVEALAKGCQAMLDFFIQFSLEFPRGPELYIAGQSFFELPVHPKIHFLGFVSEDEKISLMKSALFLLMPSPYESLSLVTLESFSLETPVLVNGNCNVLKGHCIRSNAGLWYFNYDEFKQCVLYLLNNPNVRNIMGINGKKYSDLNYQWEKVEEKLNRFFV